MDNVKRAKVIMLPTNNNSHIYHTKVNNILGYVTGKVESDLEQFPNQTNTQNQHLYITSDDEIKEGDWFIEDGCGLPINVGYNKGLSENCKKIIATTDTSLLNTIYTPHISGEISKRMRDLFKLPQPSQQFIEKYIESYNKGEIITDVLVEYERGVDEYNPNWKIETESHYNTTFKLKVNPKDNTITIKKIKDNFNLNEIEKALFNTKLLTINEFNDIWKVMKKNLG